ncbi:MAG: response regulator transcription factor [Ardenticatenaceae bacterium]|nr:response regulator transcription factor [Ardenticatenaceae bacterium]MCB9446313.1 response regulator transcription factor [Ardenticatenaceae bacterium]
MSQPKRILLVDDEASITSALSLLFARSGYEVMVADNGRAALQRLNDNPDLVVLDIMMPGMDGFEVARRIRERPSYIPILMLTARDTSLDKVTGLELGADAYLTKPFEPSELLAQVRALFRLLAKGVQVVDKERPLLCGPLTLWTAQHRVELNGQEIELTPKEFALLELFMRRPGTVFGRETLLREVWGYEYLGDSRTVDVHIQRLRAKIETDSSQPQFLHTVRGFGYRLVAAD